MTIAALPDWRYIALAVVVAFLAREWFILGWPGEATERETSELDTERARSSTLQTCRRPAVSVNVLTGTGDNARSRSAASPGHTLGAASTSQQHGLTADKAGRTDLLGGDAA